MSQEANSSQYEQFLAQMQKIADISHAQSVLNWDQETYMPAGAAASRGRQLSTLAAIAHEWSTAEELGALISSLSSDNSLDDKKKANVARAAEDYTRSKKYSTAFVVRMTELVSKCFFAWDQAKKANDWKGYAPVLEEMVALKREEAALLGYKEHPLDALMDAFEPGLTCKAVDELFDGVKQEIFPILELIKQKQQVSNDVLHLHYDKDKQWEFGMELLKGMGYDLNHGRQDVSSHPFTTSFGMEDVRVTTRIDEKDLANMVWSCIHEGGHALYEQGLPVAQYGMPLGSAVSLGIHESQSRIWENNVGRSKNYWEGKFPLLQKYFPENLKDVSLDTFYKAMNKVQPSLIRTEADELTYHFHILIRYEMEKALIEGSLEVKDARDAWNEKYKNYLGVTVSDDAHGILQDVHWSHGGFGYFPTYSLGSFYAAQFYYHALQNNPNLEQDIKAGDSSKLLQWLRTNIHQYGRQFIPAELCKKATGESLNIRYFKEYAQKKYAAIYGF